MRITDIKINNYRAFYGEHHICLDKDGKNLMLYGENGSGKSSLFTALKDFFLSSVQKLKDVEENIFIPASQKGTANIKITIKESAESSKSIEFELNALQKELVSGDKIVISDANKIKGFFDYRKLLETHINHIDHVNLFKLLIENILPDSINRFTNSEIGHQWKNIKYDVYEQRQGHWVVKSVKKSIESFNNGLKEILVSIQEDTNKFIGYFDKGIQITLKFEGVEYGGRRILNNQLVELKVKYAGQEIPKHHLFLNEARLSALAISLYLASIRLNPLTGTLKLLVLDDLLIGLDMSNRLPLLEILKNHFVEVNETSRFQIIMTTYDKVWYELVKTYFGVEKWKFVEVYSKKLANGDCEIPIIKNDSGYIDRAQKYLSDKDFKASAVYIRTEFERIVKTICDKQRIPVAYKKNQKEVTSDDFWMAIESYTDLDVNIINEIKIHRGVVMNPFSHYDLEKPEFEKELTDTIASIEILSMEVGKIRKTKNIHKLEQEIEGLTARLAEKEALIQILGEKLKQN